MLAKARARFVSLHSPRATLHCSRRTLALRRAARIFVAVLVWCLAAPTLLADSSTPPPAQEKGYVFAYMLVGLFTALGLMIALRSANRSKELKYMEDDE